MRSDKELLGIQNCIVGENEGVDFLHEGHHGLTQEEIEYIRSLGDQAREDKPKPKEQPGGSIAADGGDLSWNRW